MPSRRCRRASARRSTSDGLAVVENTRARSGSMQKPTISTSRRPRRSANLPAAGEASATITCGSTMQAPISRLGLLPFAASVPLINMRSGAFAKVKSIAQPQKTSSRRSVSTLEHARLALLLLGRRLGGAARHGEPPQAATAQGARARSARRSGRTRRARTSTGRRRPSAPHRHRCRSPSSARFARGAGPCRTGRPARGSWRRAPAPACSSRGRAVFPRGTRTAEWDKSRT